MTASQPAIDLRSDTVTKPTDAMRDAMRDAEVGNDAMGEDPSVNRLEAEVAELLGKDAGLFLPSGTMANTAALIAHTRDAERPQVILEAQCHIMGYESAGIGRIVGAQPHAIASDRGAMDPDDVRAALLGPEVPSVRPTTALVCVEQTHNQYGGAIVPAENLAAIAEVAAEADVPVHMDGARLLNAAVGTGADPQAFTHHADTAWIALSKGLAAPVGSVLVGPEPWIAAAERARALLGGAMRQAGVLAAAGLVALEGYEEQLAIDHGHAQRFADGISKIEGLELASPTVDTNIVFFDVSGLGETAPSFAERMRELGVGYDGGMSRTLVRAVTHKDVDAADVDGAVERTAELVDTLR